MPTSNLPPIAPPTPPTQRVDVTVTRKPVSKSAVASLGFGIAGFVLPVGLPSLVAIVLGLVAMKKLRRGTHSGRGLAVAGTIAGGIGVIATALVAVTLLPMFLVFNQIPVLEQRGQLVRVRSTAVSYAQLSSAYPGHLAELATDPQWMSVHTRVSPRGTPVTVGDYDFAVYQGPTTDKQAILDSIATIDTTTPYYQYGECWFVRLPYPTHEPDLVFGWFHDANTDQMMVIMDDGQAKFVTPGEWEEMWEADAAKRATLAIDNPAFVPFEPPTWPGF